MHKKADLGRVLSTTAYLRLTKVSSSSSSSLFPNWHIHVQYTKILFTINNMYIQFEVAPKGEACDGGATLAIISKIYATGWYTIDIKYNNMVKKTSLKSCGVTRSYANIRQE